MPLGCHQQAIIDYVTRHPGCTLSDLMDTTPTLHSGRMSIGGGWYRPWSAHEARIKALAQRGLVQCVAGRFYPAESR